MISEDCEDDGVTGFPTTSTYSLCFKNTGIMWDDRIMQSVQFSKGGPNKRISVELIIRSLQFVVAVAVAVPVAAADAVTVAERAREEGTKRKRCYFQPLPPPQSVHY